MRALILAVALLLPGASFAASAKPPAITETQITAKVYTKSLAKKLSSKASEMAQEIREGNRANDRVTLEEFIAWIKNEVGEAFSISADYTKLVSATKVVFSAASGHSEQAYRKAWSDFLAISLKYAASFGCAFIEPIFLPPVCFVVGHITGKYLGDFIGKTIHEGVNDRTFSIRMIQRDTEEFIDAFDPFDNDEIEKFGRAWGYQN